MKNLKQINFVILALTIFLFPLFFLPFTFDFYATNKLYLLVFASLVLLLISTVDFFLNKKISWQTNLLDTPIILFLITLGLSIIISSPNKVQAVLNTNFGFLTIFSLTLLYFYLSRLTPNFKKILLSLLNISALIVAISSIIFFLQPFKNVNLPQTWQFLKQPGFNFFGSQIDLAIFLGFFLVLSLIKILQEKPAEGRLSKSVLINYLALTVYLLSLSLVIYHLIGPSSNPSNNQNQNLPQIALPPFNLSWFAAVETLKQPLTALFGVGLDNFSSIFTRVKDIGYNQSNLWQINSFNISRSAFLQILTETGIFGMLAFILVLITAYKKIVASKKFQSSTLPLIYLLAAFLLFPPSITLFFLFYFWLSDFAGDLEKSSSVGLTYDFSHLPPFYYGISVFLLVIIGASTYLLGRSYQAELRFRKSLIGFNQNQGNVAYENLRQAVILNPFIERYRVNFSQLNLIIANNLAIRAREKLAKDEKTATASAGISQEDQQNISQAIQAAINEGKAAVALNPQKAENWQNLAEIYRMIINTVQDAETWAISAYQRAIVLDPQNPFYRLNLGGINYSLGNFDEARNLFQQVVVLKPDWANAYYNLAWANFQRKDYQQAVNAMEGVLRLLDPVKNKDDYEKAKSDLENFRKILSSEQPTSPTQTGEQQKTETNLTLPSPIPTGPSPKIELPKEAKP